MNLYVHGLAKTVEEQELEGYFSYHGYVQSVKVARNEQTGKPLGYGFVRMPDPRAAKAAIEALDDYRPEYRDVYCDRLDYQVTTDELSGILAQSGITARDVRMPLNSAGQRRGFAFITLQNQADAERAIQVLSGYTVNNRSIRACLSTQRVGEAA